MIEAEISHAFPKVTAFVQREALNGTELLTFLHPTAGRQIPSGSVEPEEHPQIAAVREVFEETGVNDLKDLTQIGQSNEDLAGQAVALDDTFLLDETGVQIDRIQRGHRVSVEMVEDSHLRVSRLVYNFNSDPPARLPQPIGWGCALMQQRLINAGRYPCSDEARA